MQETGASPITSSGAARVASAAGSCGRGPPPHNPDNGQHGNDDRGAKRAKIDPKSSSTTSVKPRPTTISASRAMAPDQSGRNRDTQAWDAAPTGRTTTNRAKTPTT